MGGVLSPFSLGRGGRPEVRGAPRSCPFSVARRTAVPVDGVEAETCSLPVVRPPTRPRRGTTETEEAAILEDVPCFVVSEDVSLGAGGAVSYVGTERIVGWTPTAEACLDARGARLVRRVPRLG